MRGAGWSLGSPARLRRRAQCSKQFAVRIIFLCLQPSLVLMGHGGEKEACVRASPSSFREGPAYLQVQKSTCRHLLLFEKG